jgi:uncharacterized membrane protein
MFLLLFEKDYLRNNPFFHCTWYTYGRVSREEVLSLSLLLWFFIISLIVIIMQLAVINQKAEKIAGMIAGKERSELANLIKLRDAGILTEEEFEQKKREYESWIAEKGHSDERKALEDLHEKGLLSDEEFNRKLAVLEKTEAGEKALAAQTWPKLSEGRLIRMRYATPNGHRIRGYAFAGQRINSR